MAVMPAPDSGVTVRMYRQGHGDCFLLAFPKRDDAGAFHVLIDCGLFPGSQTFRDTEREIDIQDVVENIKESTDNHLDLVVVTHEHKDHVSGFKSAKAIFNEMSVDQLWLAWTEDPNHELANALRADYNDTLLGLTAAYRELTRLDLAESRGLRARLGDLLAFEAESDDLMGATIPGITNKQAIEIVKRRAEAKHGTLYLRPHRRPLWLPHVDDVRVFVLGPPENRELLEDPDPREDEGYHFTSPANEARALFAAAHHAPGAAALGATTDSIEAAMPFSERYRLRRGSPISEQDLSFFAERYGFDEDGAPEPWRRIEPDWLLGAEQFAMRLNSYTNNTSLVLAFELRKSRKVLLFVGDAQRGNWVSWDDAEWTEHNGLEPGEVITAEDLLNRTVLYKVGHHGSHNATLKADGLERMAQDHFGTEFVAMIPANSAWAYGKSHAWSHPLASIKAALERKARGRVFQTDIDGVDKPDFVSEAEWKRFKDRSTETPLYFEYTVPDAI